MLSLLPTRPTRRRPGPLPGPLLSAPLLTAPLLKAPLLALFVVTATALPPPASAQATGATEHGPAAAARDYRIAAGPLADALASFAAEAGISIAAAPDLVRDRTTAGLDGHYTVGEALAHLLAGTGLDAVASGLGSYALRRRPIPAPGLGAATLPPVLVNAGRINDPTSEATLSWSPRFSNAATKLNLTPRETPQTLSVVTRRQLDDFALTTVDQALTTLSGVYVQNSGVNGNAYFSRGFGVQSQYDGMPNPVGISQSNRSPLIDSAFLDRIEFLHGASGLLTGAGVPGGTVNLVRKRPTRDVQAQAEALVGSWNRRRLVGDLSGPLGSDRITGRVVAVKDDADSFVDRVHARKQGLYAALDVQLAPSTLVTASLQYQKERSRNHFGIPLLPADAARHLDRSTFIGDARSRMTKSYRLYSVALEQSLAADWTLRAAFSHARHDVESLRGAFVSGSLDLATGNGLTLRQFNNLVRDLGSDAIDVYATGPISWLGRRHELVFGFNGSRWGDASRNSGLVGTPINLYDFDPNGLAEPAGTRGPLSPRDRTTQQGIFAAGRFALSGSAKLIAGARVSWYRYRDGEGVTTQHESAVVSPYAGLVYDLDERRSIYASYADIFQPQSNRGAGGAVIDPVVGRNFELGIKGELAPGRANWSAALFQLDQTNLGMIDPATPFDEGNACEGWCYLAAGKVRTRGLDVGVQGELTSRWTLAANYSWFNSAHAAGEDDGQRYVPYMPRHNLRFATLYRPGDGRWTVGGTLRAQNGVYTDATNHRARQGSLVVVGLSTGYALTPATSLTALIDNVFDRRYYMELSSVNFVHYGEPRRFTLMLRHRF